MKIAFLHYHLRPGGVTTVIRQQAAVLDNECEVLVVCGEPPSAPFPARCISIPGLGYDPREEASSPQRIARQVYDAISEVWPGGCDVLHVHNPLLAKNRQLLKILAALQELGLRLFLQVHDFAEDGRPAVYYSDDEYPADCHYGVINSRDHKVLIQAGLSHEGVHKISNMVAPLELSLEAQLSIKPVVYPVRALRRKNIGEALLLSLYFTDEQMLAITLPPSSPSDRQSYDLWKSYTADRKLKTVFEASGRYGFAALVGAADTLITTSISEGFGFVFLEPWTAGKGLVGRGLPEICGDFEKNRVRLDHLYTSLSIPIAWIDESAFYNRWRFCLATNSHKFGIRLDPGQLKPAYATMTAGGLLDFGLLDESLQRQVIDRLISDRSAYRQLQRLNPFLSGLTDRSVFDDRIAENHQAVSRHYGTDAYRKRLLEIYHQVFSNPVRQRIRKTDLASAFLRPEKFSLLKWGEIDG